MKLSLVIIFFNDEPNIPGPSSGAWRRAFWDQDGSRPLCWPRPHFVLGNIGEIFPPFSLNSGLWRMSAWIWMDPARYPVCHLIQLRTRNFHGSLVNSECLRYILVYYFTFLIAAENKLAEKQEQPIKFPNLIKAEKVPYRLAGKFLSFCLSIFFPEIWLVIASI